MTTNSADAPEVVTCANLACGKTLNPQSDQGYPNSTVPPGYIHKLYDLTLPAFSVVCTKCGHYSLRYQKNQPD